VKPCVLIADRSPLVRLGIRMALEADGFATVMEVATADDAMRIAFSDRVDVVLLDRDLDPEMITAAGIARTVTSGGLIVLAADEEREGAMAAVRAGACGFLPKTTSPHRVPAVVRGVLAGEAAFSRSLMRSLLAPLRDHTPSLPLLSRDELTSREREVLDLMASGLHDQRIADRLGVSPVTVRRHAGTARQKLRAAGRSEALAIYQQATT
jgi:DNA-binding NarL/FixJ family response regulator